MTKQSKKQFLQFILPKLSSFSKRYQRKNVATSPTPLYFAKKDLSPVTVVDFSCQAIFKYFLDKTFSNENNVVIGEESFDELNLLENDDRKFVLNIIREQCDDNRIEWNDLKDLLKTENESEQFWTIDPIDGTKGFLRGEQYAIAIAYLTDTGKTIQYGGLSCPNYTKDANCIVSEHGERVEQKQRRAESDKFRMVTSVEHNSSLHFDSLLERLNKENTLVDRMDSQAKYLDVYHQFCDAYVRLPTSFVYREKIWDHAAGVSMLSTVGGVVTDITGKKLDLSRGHTLDDNIGVVASRNERIHSNLLQHIRDVYVNAEKPTPPRKPADSECCGNGCSPCILEFYYEEFEAYQNNFNEWKMFQKLFGIDVKETVEKDEKISTNNVTIDALSAFEAFEKKMRGGGP